MKKIIISILGIFALNSGVAIADESKITKGYHTMDAMGCMLLRE